MMRRTRSSTLYSRLMGEMISLCGVDAARVVSTGLLRDKNRFNESLYKIALTMAGGDHVKAKRCNFLISVLSLAKSSGAPAIPRTLTPLVMDELVWDSLAPAIAVQVAAERGDLELEVVDGGYLLASSGSARIAFPLPGPGSGAPTLAERHLRRLCKDVVALDIAYMSRFSIFLRGLRRGTLVYANPRECHGLGDACLVVIVDRPPNEPAKLEDIVRVARSASPLVRTLVKRGACLMALGQGSGLCKIPGSRRVCDLVSRMLR